MAYVPVPKDLSKIKTKLAFNLTKRQLICFSGAAAVGIPVYLLTRSAIGNTPAMLLMVGLRPSGFCDMHVHGNILRISDRYNIPVLHLLR